MGHCSAVFLASVTGPVYLTVGAGLVRMECEIDGCDGDAVFELHIPWKENERVCAGHARTRSRQEGVVADALEDAADDLPEGAT